VIQNPPDGADDQAWTLVRNGAQFIIQTVQDPNFVLDLQNGDPGDHIWMQVYKANGGQNQLWTFV
jgi:hypothetical protein